MPWLLTTSKRRCTRQLQLWQATLQQQLPLLLLRKALTASQAEAVMGVLMCMQGWSKPDVTAWTVHLCKSWKARQWQQTKMLACRSYRCVPSPILLDTHLASAWEIAQQCCYSSRCSTTQAALCCLCICAACNMHCNKCAEHGNATAALEYRQKQWWWLVFHLELQCPCYSAWPLHIPAAAQSAAASNAPSAVTGFLTLTSTSTASKPVAASHLSNLLLDCHNMLKAAPPMSDVPLANQLRSCSVLLLPCVHPICPSSVISAVQRCST